MLIASMQGSLIFVKPLARFRKMSNLKTKIS